MGLALQSKSFSQTNARRKYDPNVPNSCLSHLSHIQNGDVNFCTQGSYKMLRVSLSKREPYIFRARTNSKIHWLVPIGCNSSFLLFLQTFCSLGRHCGHWDGTRTMTAVICKRYIISETSTNQKQVQSRPDQWASSIITTHSFRLRSRIRYKDWHLDQTWAALCRNKRKKSASI